MNGQRMKKAFGLAAIIALISSFSGIAKADGAYFPLGTWGAAPGAWTEVEQAVFFETWFGGQLAAMKERPLWNEPRASETTLVVRLLFLPTFDHGTMLRLAISESGGTSYVFKELDGAGGYEPGNLQRKIAGAVDDETAGDILSLIDVIGALEGRTPAQVFNPNYVCTDGTTLVLEFSYQRTYSAITRHECEIDANDPIRQLIGALNLASGGQVIAPNVYWTRE